jgi:hypothetical protein
MGKQCQTASSDLALAFAAETPNTLNMIEAGDFPVGPKPEWELEQPEPDQEISLPLKSVADRCFSL